MMRKTALLLASAAVAILCFWTTPGSVPTAAQVNTVKPNSVFILADDLRKEDLNYMPKTDALLVDEGMQFQNAFISLPVCCPSRATITRGQYAHNTEVWNNGYDGDPDGGGKATQTTATSKTT